MSAKNVLLDVKRNVNELQFFQKILYFNFFQAFFIFDLHILCFQNAGGSWYQEENKE